ncbi:MAG: hypothetical protein HY744_30475 [Deltaproteobacteria bacterium]|nr:hypothetical protein [Deltaproteobacteria bacterium]
MRHAAMRTTVSVLLATVLAALAARVEAEVIELQNDGVEQEGTVGFQKGFAEGEMGAATLGPVDEGYRINKVHFVFGPKQEGSETYNVTVHVYEDTGETDPGEELYVNAFQVEPSSEAMQELDMSGDDILMEAKSSFRVAIELMHTGLPSIARDNDGSCNGGRNWIYGEPAPQPKGWYDFCTDLGGDGDWVIRAEVETGAAGGAGGAGGGAGASGTGAAAGSGAAPTCQPSESLTCIGADGCTGTQICSAAGSWGACQCAAAGEPDEDGGCGYSLPGRSAPGRAALVLGAIAALALAGARRLRRRG